MPSSTTASAPSYLVYLSFPLVWCSPRSLSIIMSDRLIMSSSCSIFGGQPIEDEELHLAHQLSIFLDYRCTEYMASSSPTHPLWDCTASIHTVS